MIILFASSVSISAEG